MTSWIVIFEAILLLGTLFYTIQCNVLLTVIGRPGQSGYSPDGMKASNALLSGVRYGLFVTPSKEIYFCESNQLVRKISKDGIVTTIAGINGVSGVSSDGLLGTNTVLNYPNGVAVSPFTNETYFCDTYNNMIRKVGTNGIVSRVGGAAGYTSPIGDGGLVSQARFNNPMMVMFTQTGDMLITDTGTSLVRRVAVNGVITTFAGKANTYGLSGDGGLATDAVMNAPHGIAISKLNEIYIADTYSHVIRKVFSNGTITTAAGTGRGFTVESGLATQAKFNYPYSIAVDKYDNLYIADYGNHAIRKVFTNGTIITFIGNGARGYSPDGTAVSASSISNPYNLFIQGDELYFDDALYTIRKVLLTTPQCSRDTRVSIKNLGGSVSFQFNINTTNAIRLFVIPNSDSDIEDVNLLMNRGSNCSNLIGSTWQFQQLSYCEKQFQALISFSTLNSQCLILQNNVDFFDEFAGELRVVEIENETQKHYKYKFNMRVQRFLRIVESFEVIQEEVKISLALLLQVYRATSHSLFVRFRLVARNEGELQVNAEHLLNNIDSIELVRESLTCNNITCSYIFGLTLNLQPLSCFTEGNVRIIANSTVLTGTSVGLLSIFSENVCTVFSETASANGTLVLKNANTGVSSSQYQINTRLQALLTVQSRFVLQSVSIDSAVLCASTDNTIDRCSSNIGRLNRYTALVVNGFPVQSDSVVTQNQLQFTLAPYMTLLNTTHPVKHILELLVRIQFGTLQQEVIPLKLVYKEDDSSTTYSQLTSNFVIIDSTVSSSTSFKFCFALVSILFFVVL